jgi:hypothetical protein
MLSILTVNTIAECLRTDCNRLGIQKKICMFHRVAVTLTGSPQHFASWR